MKYQKKDISDALNKLDLRDTRVVSIKTDLRLFGRHCFSNGEALLLSFYEAICEKIDLSAQTLVVATSSHSLCNTDIPFDIENTRSEMGALTEFIRCQPGSIRSNHPFGSYTAIGNQANYICSNNSLHVYGPHSPKARMLELGTQLVNFGVHPYDATTVIHHAEFMAGVPYRYAKEFWHPILRNGVVENQHFYMHVRYLQSNIVRNIALKMYPAFFEAGHQFQEVGLGQGKVYSFSMNEFYDTAMSVFKDDLYAYVETPIVEKPYLL